MKKKEAFRFISELIGDFSHVMELSANPKQLYIETAISTLHMGEAVFKEIAEHANMKNKEYLKKQMEEAYDGLEESRKINYELEILYEIDTKYEAVKININESKFRDKEVLGFITLLEKKLNKLINILEKMQVDLDAPERERVEELTRKALRDYERLVTKMIQEEEIDG